MKPADFFRPGDALLYFVCIAAAAVGLVTGLGGSKGRSVQISSPAGRYRYSLDGVREVRVRGAQGLLVVQVSNGQARVVEAFCPDHICVRRGWISREGDSAACVPNRTVIRIEAGGSGGFDAVTE